MRESFITGILFTLLASLLVAQQPEPLTLQQAVAIALEHNPRRKAALAETHAASADVQMTRSAFFPRIDFSEAFTRSNDPVYVFGTKLRQSRFTAADFALNRLNQPTPISNFATRFGVQWTIFDSFASSLSLRRSKQVRQAASEQLAMADQQTVFRVIEAYYGLLFANRQLEVAEKAAETAKTVMEDSRVRVEAGTAVESDLLSAQVNLATRKEELVRARNASSLARAQLNASLGVSLDRDSRISEALPERKLEEIPLRTAEEQAIQQRPDLKEASAQVAAQKTGVQLAKSAFGPHIDVFAASEIDNATFTANGSNNWTVGAELRIELFSGGRKIAQLSHEKAALEHASAIEQATEDNVRLEARRAFYDWDSARQTMDVGRAAVAQAEESLRITRNRYGSGLTTITELLKTEDSLRTAETNYWESVYRYNVSYAALELAMGSLNAQSPVVTP
jgi:outer membrane protein TolC